MSWPDIVIAIVLGLGAISGFRRGLIGELSGIVALGAAIAAGFGYTGRFDPWVADRTHLGAGSAHVVGILCFALVAYAIVIALGAVLSRIAKLPIIGLANAAGGAAIGLCKSLVFVWVALYVALFFPLPPDLREQLHASLFVALIESPNKPLDDHVRDSLPDFAKPLSGSLFDHHRV